MASICFFVFRMGKGQFIPLQSTTIITISIIIIIIIIITSIIIIIIIITTIIIIISLVDSIACHMRTASLCQGLGERSMAGLFWGWGHL